MAALMSCLIHRKVVVVGAGYIAVELAGIFNALGSDTSICIRYDHVSIFLVYSVTDSLFKRRKKLCFVSNLTDLMFPSDTTLISFIG